MCVLALCQVEIRRIEADEHGVRVSHAQQRHLLDCQRLWVGDDLRRHEQEVQLLREGHITAAEFIELRKLDRGQK